MPKQLDKQQIRNLIDIYKRNLDKEFGINIPDRKVESREYQEFKAEYMPKHLTLYEKLCNISAKILNIKPLWTNCLNAKASKK